MPSSAAARVENVPRLLDTSPNKLLVVERRIWPMRGLRGYATWARYAGREVWRGGSFPLSCGRVQQMIGLLWSRGSFFQHLRTLVSSRSSRISWFSVYIITAGGSTRKHPASSLTVLNKFECEAARLRLLDECLWFNAEGLLHRVNTVAS